MKKTTYIIMTALAAAALAAAGCAKQEACTVAGPARQMSIEPEVDVTRATLIGNTDGLRNQGFGVSIYNGTTAYKDKVTMTYDGGWKPSGGTMDWKWPAGQAYSFYAWSPAALITGVTASGVQAFTYTGIAAQTDVMLGCYTGTGVPGAGNTCSATVKFSHALASIQFKTGTITGLGNITKVELSGVATSGTCTPSYSGSSTVGFAWSGFSGSTTLTQSGLSVASTTSGTAIGTPFLVLPQSAALTVTLTDSGSKTVTATISAPTLTVGHTAVYTVNYDGQTANFTLSIESWTNGQSGNVTVEEEEVPTAFTVSEGKTVQFSKGNLYWDGSKFLFEENQWSFVEIWNPSHVSHFYWSETESVAYAVSYSDSGAAASDVFFTNDPNDAEMANPNFTVNGVKGKFRTLSSAEWTYLLNTRTVNSGTGEGKSYQRATINSDGTDVFGLILYPDNYTEQTGATSYTSAEWAAMESVGCVFLPAAGCRDFENCFYVYGSGGYWSSSTGGHGVYYVDFGDYGVTISSETRDYGFSVRLVTDVE